jgi:hypothetical protein
MWKLIVSLSFLALFMAASGKTALGGPIDDLKPGHWYMVPNSNLSAVTPNPTPPGYYGPAAVTDAWSGGAYDTKRDRLIIWGGGHGDYAGNEVYVFDINALRWSRIWGPTPNVPFPGGCDETYSDGNPVSRHTYDGLEYLPNVDRFISNDGSLYQCGWSTRGTWMFDFDNLQWTRRADRPEAAELGPVSAYDSVTGRFLVDGAGSRPLYEYDPQTNIWTRRGASPMGNYQQVGAFDSKRRLLVRIGDGEVNVYDLKQSGLVTPQRVTTTGATAMVNATYIGFEYDPVSDRFVAWHGGADVYLLNPDTWVWTRITPASTNTVIPTAAPHQGTFGRFRYIPSKNAFITFNSIYGNVYVYKLSSGGGTPSPSDTTAPTAPTNLSATTQSSSQINLSWTSSTDNVGVTGYRVERCQGSSCTNFAQIATPIGTSYSDTGLSANTTYRYRVRAADAAGNLSGYSSIVNATTQAATSFDFSLSNGGNRSVTQGQSISNTITATLVSGTAQSVSFSASGLPSGATSTYSSTSCVPTCNIAMTTTTSASTPAGTYTITLTGSGGGLSRTTSFTLTVNTATTSPPPSSSPSGGLEIPLNTWVSRTVPAYPTAPGPSYTKHVRLAFDPNTRLTYFWGGDNCVDNGIDPGRCNSREELYSYDAAQDKWTLVLSQTDANQNGFPTGRCVAGFTWDPKRKVVWMVGGQERYGSYYPGLQSGGLWAFNPATRQWTREGPDPRQGSFNEVHFMAYDPVNDGLFIIDDGRVQFYPLSQVIIGDGVEQNLWTNLSFPVQDPYLVGYNIIHAVDTKRNRAVIYSPYRGETWAYDFTARITTRLSQQVLPMKANFTMVYDSANDLVALWGGGTDFDPDLNDLWVFNPETNQWSKPALGGDIPKVGLHPQLTFDSVNNAVVLYGEKVYLLRLGLGQALPPPSTPPASPTALQVQ